MSSSSSPSSSSHQWKHEVFLSFRGADKRYSFIAHLSERLKEMCISYFRDDDIDNTGMEIGDMIFRAIEHARIALVAFSEDYVNSKWCLNELVEILNCKRDHNLVVIPIFFIPTAEVKKWARDGKFEKALRNLAGEEKGNKEKDWKKALKDASEINGFNLLNHANRNEAKLVDMIVKRLVKEIHQIRPLSFVKDAIGADHMADDVISLLKIGDKKGAHMVGICGPEGIGKTTVAGIAFNKIRDEVECPVFLAKIGEASESERLELRKALLQKLGGEECSNVFGALTDEIKRSLRCKEIFLVLDGVTDKKQVEDFGIERPTDKGKWEINDGSRILITTRDRALLNDLKVHDKYIVKGLHQDVARQLFRRHAFTTERPAQHFEELSESLTHYAGGHPSTLKRLGSYVSGEEINHWRKTLDKLVRSASALSFPLQSVGRYGGQGGGAHEDATHTAVDPDYPNEYRTPIDSIGADLGLSSRAYPFEVVGPFGVVDGTTTWKDEGYTDVREIVVYVGSNPKAIKSISIIYDKCGRPSDRIQHGTTEGGEPYTITLDYPWEYLTAISGHTEKVSRLTTLRSLTIHTKDKHYGPYGTTKGKRFSFPYTGGKIVGFHGSCNDSRLESIGAFYKPIPHTYPVNVFGPFEDEGENSSDFGDIKGIAVRYSDFIKSITFEVDDATSSEPQTSYVTDGGENSFEVKLKEGEYITSFSGHFSGRGNRNVINSLTFRTNKRILGPIGREGRNSKYFSLPPEAGKVIGCFGRSDNFLESIGARVELCSNKLYPFESVGLFGWESGSKWDDGKQHTNVRKIIVELDSSGEGFIRSIAFQYEEENNVLSQLKIHPDIDGNESSERTEFRMIEMEYLTSISGYMFQPNNETVGLASLTFQTNKRTLKCIGHEKGRHFSSPATGGKIVGFYGWSGEHLNAIGAYFEPISNLYPIKSIGPFGGHLGQGECDGNWNVGQIDDVRNIEVMHNDAILCIKFVYNNSSQQDHLVPHDGLTREDMAKVTRIDNVSLKYPENYLTSISGYQRDNGDGINNAIIQSLTFHSNRKTYGPFGKETGRYFWYPSTGSKIIGFFGRCGETLNSIGVYAQPMPRLGPFKTVSPFGYSGGSLWDDGVHTDVRAIHILASDVIHSIRIVYDNNGSIVEGSEHGEKLDSYRCDEGATLDYPKERLLSIFGWMKPSERNSDPIIRDLKIRTTKTVYGPFGTEEWPWDAPENTFRIPLKSGGGRIVGFFGTAGPYLNSIGARLEP